MTLPSPLITPRLLIRSWMTEDAGAFEAAASASLTELRPWLPWAREDISRQWPALQDFIAQKAGSDLLYGVFNRFSGRLLGGVGLHARNEPDDREIGYWLRTDATGAGYMTEAVRAVTDAAFLYLNLRTVTIVCDANNQRSAGIPKRLGFAGTGIHPPKAVMSDRPGDLIWRTTREEWRH